MRAIDRAGNVDPTPAVHQFDGIERRRSRPDILSLETPPNPSGSNARHLHLHGAPTTTRRSQFMEFECRIDTIDPEAWLECTNPAVFANLPPGEHTVQVRATDAADNIDPSPATYTWTVGTAGRL